MQRVRTTFWALVVITVVSTGLLMRAVAWRASPLAGITVAAAGFVAVVAVGLAARILVVTSRVR